MFESLASYTDADFYCFITDTEQIESTHERVRILTGSDLSLPVARQILNKYKGSQLRWAIKPVILLYLLEKGYDVVLYADNDIYFFSSPDFLFEALQEKAVLLTPHYYPANPLSDQIWFEANFRVGLFNAGFVGVSQKAKAALNWWAGCCLYAMKKSYRRGLFDDQKYLDLFPIMFEDVEIVKHRGCNVAGWNIHTSARSLDAHGNLQFNDKWPLLFVHFNYYTIQCILNNTDPLLKPAWHTYHEMLCRFNPNYRYEKELKPLNHTIRAYYDYALFRFNRLFD